MNPQLEGPYKAGGWLDAAPFILAAVLISFLLGVWCGIRIEQRLQKALPGWEHSWLKKKDAVRIMQHHGPLHKWVQLPDRLVFYRDGKVITALLREDYNHQPRGEDHGK